MNRDSKRARLGRENKMRRSRRSPRANGELAELPELAGPLASASLQGEVPTSIGLDPRDLHISSARSPLFPSLREGFVSVSLLTPFRGARSVARFENFVRKGVFSGSRLNAERETGAVLEGAIGSRQRPRYRRARGRLAVFFSGGSRAGEAARGARSVVGRAAIPSLFRERGRGPPNQFQLESGIFAGQARAHGRDY